MSQQEELESMLRDKSTAKRRTAAKRIQKAKPIAIGEPLYVALKRELELGKYWQTEVAMIRALGAIRYEPAKELLKRICYENKDYDMVTYTAAIIFVRLQSASLSDIKPVFELLDFGKYAVSSGAVAPIGFDKMMPNEKDIRELIAKCWDLGIDREEHYLDPRYPVAAACALWPKGLVREFLEHCVETGDEHLRGIAGQALEGKYVSMAE